MLVGNNLNNHIERYAMQIQRFETGGYVIHKIPVGNGRASAWFNADHTLADIEQFNRAGRVQRVSKTNREYIAKYGPIWVGK